MEEAFERLALTLAEQQAENNKELNRILMETHKAMADKFVEALGANNDASDGYSTVKVPLYDGKRDPTAVGALLSGLELRIAAKNMTREDQMIIQLGSHLTGEAQMWFHNYVGNHYDKFSYNQVLTEFQGRFLPLNCHEDAREKLKTIRQTGSVEKYISYFNSL